MRRRKGDVKLLPPRQPTEHGFSLHFVLPIIAIVGAAAIGTYLIRGTHAATTGCVSYAYDFKAQTLTLPESSTPTKDVKATNSNFGPCLGYIERMLNIAYATNYAGFAVYADGFKDTAPATVTVKGYIGLSSPSVYSLSVDGKYSANLLNRVHAFQNFFAYGATDAAIDSRLAPYKSGTTWSPSTAQLALCGIAEHTTSTMNNMASDAVGLALHYGCPTGVGLPTWRSNIKSVEKPPVVSTTLACAANGTGGVKFSFSDPNGVTTAQLTVTYASGVSPATATTSYSAPSSALATNTVSIAAAKVAGTWSAKLVAADLWGTQTKSVTTSHATCKPATIPSVSGGSTGGSSSSGVAAGCADISDSSCFPSYQDPCTADPSSCASDPDQYDTICDTSCYDTSSDGSSLFSSDGSDSSDLSGLGSGCTDTCEGSSTTDSSGSGDSTGTAGGNSALPRSGKVSSSEKKSANIVARFFRGVRSALDKLF